MDLNESLPGSPVNGQQNASSFDVRGMTYFIATGIARSYRFAMKVIIHVRAKPEGGHRERE